MTFAFRLLQINFVEEEGNPKLRLREKIAILLSLLLLVHALSVFVWLLIFDRVFFNLTTDDTNPSCLPQPLDFLCHFACTYIWIIPLSLLENYHHNGKWLIELSRWALICRWSIVVVAILAPSVFQQLIFCQRKRDYIVQYLSTKVFPFENSEQKKSPNKWISNQEYSYCHSPTSLTLSLHVAYRSLFLSAPSYRAPFPGRRVRAVNNKTKRAPNKL